MMLLIMNEQTILQITGEAGAGKSDVCAHLAKKYDFTVVLVSDLIRSFAREKNLVLGARNDYLEAHKQMKYEQGMDIIAKSILETPANKICVDGIRVMSDVDRLRKAQGVVSKVIALHCPSEVRFERAIQRNSVLDGLTFEEFLENDRRDAYNPDPERQNTLAVMSAADHHIDASLPQKSVFRSIDEIVAPLLLAQENRASIPTQ